MRAVLLLTLLASLLLFTAGDPITCTTNNEMYACGSACQTECATLGQPCPIVNIKCNDACYCVEGYARNSKGTCIPKEDC